MKIARSVKKMIITRPSNIIYSRVYIPKGDKGDLRPLGVPTPEYRVFLHM